MPPQNAMHGRDGDADRMEALQIAGDLRWSEVVALPEVQDLADHRWRDRCRGAPWRPRSIAEAGHAELVEALLPLVERAPGNPEMPTGLGDVARRCGPQLQDLEPPGG